MSIIVTPISTPYKIIFNHGGEVVEFTLRQLDFRTRNIISSMTTVTDKGRIHTDATLALFLNLKYGVIGIKGLSNVDGSEYVLEYEDETNKALKDEVVDALLMTPFSDNLIYAAREMIEGVPSEIRHPITGLKIEGVEVVLPSEMEVIEKK